ncbi:MAG: hypothetical protein JO340_00980 [Acidobacteriaceae bacterium]|nr:hypothetical protein [Acidobacteriaceae bacterium]
MRKSDPVPSENFSDLVATQINFGLAYIREAQNAYGEGRLEYGDLARQIAVNAYATASRFAVRLSKERDNNLLSEVARFKVEVDCLRKRAIAIPSIA